MEESTQGEMTHFEVMALEHAAWLDVVEEFKKLGLDMNTGGNALDLHNAIVKWGEELVLLRVMDPDASHALNAREERRAAYPGTNYQQLVGLGENT